MSDTPRPAIKVEALGFAFRLHNVHQARIPVFDDLSLAVRPGECLVLAGPSGSGKSTLLRSIYGNYRPTSGRILVDDGGDYVDVVGAGPRRINGMRRRTVGYVSQVLRVIPRVASIDLVMEPLLEQGVERAAARDRAAAMLDRLSIPPALWDIPPATFSGGEKQRINIARSFVRDWPVLLLDEPTASLDAGNRDAVIGLVGAALDRGAAILSIFHDQEVRRRAGTRVFQFGQRH